MLLITHVKNKSRILAFLIGERIYDCYESDARLPMDPEAYLEHYENYKPIALMVENMILTGQLKPSFIEIGEGLDIKVLVWPEL